MLYTLAYEGQAPLKYIQNVRETGWMTHLRKSKELNIIFLYLTKNTLIEAIHPLFLYTLP